MRWMTEKQFNERRKEKEEKATHGSRRRKKYSQLPISQWSLSISWEARPRYTCWLFQKTFTRSVPPSISFFPQLLLLSNDVTVWDIPLVSLGLLPWPCPHPTSCLPSAYWLLQGSWRDRLEAVSALLSSSRTSVWYQHCSSYKCKAQTALYGLLWGNLTPSQPDSVQ